MHADSLMEHFAHAASRVIAIAEGHEPESSPRHEGPVDGRYVLELIETARSVTHDDFFGLAAKPCPLGANRFMNEVVVRCGNLAEGLDQAFKFIGLACPAAHFRLLRDGAQATIEIAIDDNGNDVDDLLLQWNMLTLHKMAQWMTGTEILLDRVEFPNGMHGGYSDYAVLFSNDCVFNAKSARMTFAAHHLARRVVRTAQDFDRLLDAPQGNFAEPKTVSTTWRQRVRRSLRADLGAQRPMSMIEELADEFGVSSQTLRRRLKAEGSSYRLLKSEIRREAALDAMSDDNAPLGNASIRAGFAEPNGLTRALKASGGLGPSDLRMQVRHWRAS